MNKIEYRNARLTDAAAISKLVNHYAKTGIMLFKPVESIIEGIRNFIVAESNGEIIGCCAVSFFTEELGEIRSIAVKEDSQRSGIGRELVSKAEEILRDEGIKFAFALTLNEPFFNRLGYIKVDKSKFPQKIWRDCLGCSKIMKCDEVAMEKELSH